jgi:succinate-semialdehyde dehydrogenase/glutarate-semialdehyde dehydrogenase
MITSFNPATGETLATFASHDDAHIETTLAQANRAQKQWAALSLAERLPYLLAVAKTLRRNKEALARLITLEMGKPLGEAIGEVEKCAWNFEYYAESAPQFLDDLIIPSGATDSRVVYDPLGLILAVMPWNYPFWQVMRAAAPVLVSGLGRCVQRSRASHGLVQHAPGGCGQSACADPRPTHCCRYLHRFNACRP